MSEIYSEVKCDFFDEVRKCWTVDAWRTGDDCEEGEVVALVTETGGVIYLNDDARNSTLVQEAIESRVKSV